MLVSSVRLDNASSIGCVQPGVVVVDAAIWLGVIIEDIEPHQHTCNSNRTLSVRSRDTAEQICAPEKVAQALLLAEEDNITQACTRIEDGECRPVLPF